MAAINDLSSQQFYHGTKADLKLGDLICNPSDIGERDRIATYVYLTPNLDAAIWGTELAIGEGHGRVYIVEPIGQIENAPELTEQKSPKHLSMSYRSREPLRLVSEVMDWQGHSPQAIETMKDNLERLKQLGVEAIED